MLMKSETLSTLKYVMKGSLNASIVTLVYFPLNNPKERLVRQTCIMKETIIVMKSKKTEINDMIIHVLVYGESFVLV